MVPDVDGFECLLLKASKLCNGRPGHRIYGRNLVGRHRLLEVPLQLVAETALAEH
jgi:hypothetical protein